MRITTEILTKARACTSQVKVFAKEWPNGATVNLKNVCRAQEIGLDLEWAAQNLFEPAEMMAAMLAVLY